MRLKRITATTEQSGQTLIETVVAIFILIIGIGTAMSLANISYNAADAASRQVIGTALARQGLEAVKNIRDTNWLNDTLSTTCNINGTPQSCYPDWLGSGATAIPTSGNGDVVADFIKDQPTWTIAPSLSSYTLSYSPIYGYFNPTAPGYAGLQNNAGITATNYYRQLTFAPDNAVGGSINGISITSTVWWQSRGCELSAITKVNPATLPGSCKITLQLDLTNWKDY